MKKKPKTKPKQTKRRFKVLKRKTFIGVTGIKHTLDEGEFYPLGDPSLGETC